MPGFCVVGVLCRYDSYDPTSLCTTDMRMDSPIEIGACANCYVCAMTTVVTGRNENKDGTDFLLCCIVVLCCIPNSSDAASGDIRIYRPDAGNEPIHTLKLHNNPVTFLAFNSAVDTVMSIDAGGFIEYWNAESYEFPTGSHSVLKFKHKIETDLYEFVKLKTAPTSLSVSNDGRYFVAMSRDRMIRVFTFATGKLYRVFDEGLATYEKQQLVSLSAPVLAAHCSLPFLILCFAVDGYRVRIQRINSIISISVVEWPSNVNWTKRIAHRRKQSSQQQRVVVHYRLHRPM